MTVANISALITRLIFLYLQTKLLNFNGSKDTAKQQMKKRPRLIRLLGRNHNAYETS